MESWLRSTPTWDRRATTGRRRRRRSSRPPSFHVKPGQTLKFSIWLSGAFTKAYGIVGIEGFDAAHLYISEADTNVKVLTSTPTQFSVTYLCPPNTNYVAVYVQDPEISAMTVIFVTMDDATLVVTKEAPGSGG